MKIKTAALTGPALDGAVAKCWYGDDYDLSIPLFDDGLIFAPSTNWAHGGPIIERKEIFLAKSILGGWTGSIYTGDRNCILHGAPTPLIAAMRCYVASKLGEDVNIPEELL